MLAAVNGQVGADHETGDVECQVGRRYVGIRKLRPARVSANTQLSTMFTLLALG